MQILRDRLFSKSLVLAACWLVSYLGLALFALEENAFAQADIRISGAQSGFPIAVPKLCDAGGANDLADAIPQRVVKNLQISGMFRVLNPATFVENAGKCDSSTTVAYSDWSVISADGLVKGQITRNGNALRVQLYLHDVQQQKAVLGKQYDLEIGEVNKAADRFTNEIIKYFTGELGMFGTRISYVSRVGRFKEVFAMDVDGSNVVQITKDRGLAISPSWSPSGDKLVYTSYATRRPELYLSSPTGGGAKRLTNREGLELGAEFSPDGRSIIAGVTVSGISKIAVMGLNGDLIKRLTSSSSIDVSPSFSPDGSTLVFCSNRSGGPQIYVMSADGANPRRISYTNSNYCTSPQYSPKGDKLAFVCRAGGGNQIFVVPTTGGAGSQLTFVGNNEDPSWSPDGRYLAISSDFGRGNRSLGILSLQTGQVTQVTFAKSEDSQPSWSPRLE